MQLDANRELSIDPSLLPARIKSPVDKRVEIIQVHQTTAAPCDEKQGKPSDDDSLSKHVSARDDVEPGNKVKPEMKPSGDTKLGEDDIVLGKYDIICGRHKDAEDHVGNRRFRVIVDIHKGYYGQAKTKEEKTRVSLRVVGIIRNCGGGFLKVNPSTGRWYDIGDSGAREKVSLALRLANMPKKEKPEKKRKKEESKPPLPTTADDAMVAKLLVIQQHIFRRLIEEADQQDQQEEDTTAEPPRKRQRPSKV